MFVPSMAGLWHLFFKKLPDNFAFELTIGHAVQSPFLITNFPDFKDKLIRLFRA
jgi:hypothetical protein